MKKGTRGKPATLRKSCQFIDSITGDLLTEANKFLKFISKVAIMRDNHIDTELHLSLDPIKDRPEVTTNVYKKWQFKGVTKICKLHIRFRQIDKKEEFGETLDYTVLPYITSSLYLFLREYIACGYSYRAELKQKQNITVGKNFVITVKLSDRITAEITSLIK